MVMQALVDDMVNRIVRHCSPERIVLYGSLAKGESHAGSDIDLLVIQNTEVPRPYRELELKPLFTESPVPVDLVVMTEAEYEDESRKPYTLAYSVSVSGIVKYESKKKHITFLDEIG